MKRLALVLITLILLLTSCGSATSQPTATVTTTITPTETPTIIPTNTPKPTSTPRPTATATPMLPTSVIIEFNNAVPEKVKLLVEKTVTQAYWFYVNLGCSPNGFKVTITNEENGEATAIDGFKVGWDDLNTKQAMMAIRVSHETAHIMCQHAFTRYFNMGAIDVRWLTEGVANYFSAMERITNSGTVTGQPEPTIDGNTIGMAEWISQNFCDTPLNALEPSNADTILQDFAGVGQVATSLLVKINPNGIKAIMQYYTLLNKIPNKDAFEQAFGMTKKEFYKQFQDECNNGFPTLTLTEGSVQIQGNVIFADGSQNFNHYMITFCNINKSACGPSTVFRKDGTFIINLEADSYYRASINPSNGGESIGWYNSRGLVKNTSCAGLIKVSKDMKITISIDLKNIISC